MLFTSLAGDFIIRIIGLSPNPQKTSKPLRPERSRLVRGRELTRLDSTDHLRGTPPP